MQGCAGTMFAHPVLWLRMAECCVEAGLASVPLPHASDEEIAAGRCCSSLWTTQHLCACDTRPAGSQLVVALQDKRQRIPLGRNSLACWLCAGPCSMAKSVLQTLCTCSAQGSTLGYLKSLQTRQKGMLLEKSYSPGEL